MIALAAIVVLMAGADAWAWGPVTHIKLASDVLSNLWLLPTALGALITRHRRFFLFGNVATDTVFAKKMSKIKQVCHQWNTGFSLLDSAKTNSAKAFAYGYLAHLAADTVAHNKFLPRQMAVSRSTVSFGHLYWEIRADAMIDKKYWARLRARLHERYDGPERMLETHVRQTMLSFRTNMAIFRRVNMLGSLKGWRRSVEFWSRLSRHQLDEAMLQQFHAEAIGRIVDVLSNGRASSVLQLDPNGNAALAYAKAQRKQLRQMRRARLPVEHVIEEATAGHAPSAKAASILNVV